MAFWGKMSPRIWIEHFYFLVNGVVKHSWFSCLSMTMLHPLFKFGMDWIGLPVCDKSNLEHHFKMYPELHNYTGYCHPFSSDPRHSQCIGVAVTSLAMGYFFFLFFSNQLYTPTVLGHRNNNFLFSSFFQDHLIGANNHYILLGNGGPFGLIVPHLRLDK